MPKYRFQWANLPDDILGLLVEDDEFPDKAVPPEEAAEVLRETFGARPDEEFVRECWELLRDHWLASDDDARKVVVEELWERGVGAGTRAPTSRGAEMRFLGSCRNARGLRQIVLNEFIKLGENEQVATTEPSNPAPPSVLTDASDSPKPTAPETLHDVTGNKQASLARPPSVSPPASEKSGGTGIKNHAAFIWSIADLLRGDYKQSEYGKVVLPLTVIRRLDCVLEATKPEVLKRHAASPVASRTWSRSCRLPQTSSSSTSRPSTSDDCSTTRTTSPTTSGPTSVASRRLPRT